MDTSADRNVTVIFSVRSNVEFQVKLTTKFRNVQCRKQDAIGIVVENVGSLPADGDVASEEYCMCSRH